MPKYFKTKQDQLHCEAFALALLVTALYNENNFKPRFRINPKTGEVKQKTGIYWIMARANTRVARRFTHKIQASF